MFLLVGIGLTSGASFVSSLFPPDALEQCSAEKEGTLPVDHTPTIKSVKTYKIIISFSLYYS